MPMARSGLSVYLYTPPGTGFYGQATVEIGSSITSLDFSSAAPGGFTDFHATLPLRDGRFPFPALQMFAQVEVKSGLTVVWAGELTEPMLTYDETQGEYMQLTGLGYGNALRDYPFTVAFVGQTVRAMAISAYNNYAVGQTGASLLSSDTTALFPDNPAGFFSPAYDNRTVEDVFADICQLAGDYHWGTWAHPALNQTNGAGFRLGQPQIHLRDTATTHYSISLAERDVVALSVGPSAERAYNTITIDYSNSSGLVRTAGYTDSRLGAGSSQGSAPFRRRRLTRDYTGTSTIGGTQAQSIANTFGAQYQNPSNKFTATIRRVHDDKGQPFALAEVLADHNLYVRDLAQRSTGAMPTTPTAGINLFYLVSTTYREDSSGMQLEVEGDNFVDRTETQVARLTLAADVKARSGKTTGVAQAFNAPANGAAIIGQSNAISGQVCTGGMQWPNLLYTAPTSVAFTQVVRVNLNAPSAANLAEQGGIIQATASASATVQGMWTYTTAGNCLRAIHGKTFDWHCDSCDREYRGLSIAEHLHIQTGRGTQPGYSGLSVVCPECDGFAESFNTALTGRDETHPHHPHRAEQARLIRQLMRHGAVALDVLP